MTTTLLLSTFFRILSIYESKESLFYPIRGVKHVRSQVRPGIKRRASLHNFSKNTRKRDVRERIARASEIFASRQRHSAPASRNREWCSATFNNSATTRRSNGEWWILPCKKKCRESFARRKRSAKLSRIHGVLCLFRVRNPPSAVSATGN